jgi:hypothetical protein
MLARHAPHSALRAALTRRELALLAAAGVGGAASSGWLPALAAHAAAENPSARRKSCVLLWMDGGPSHVDTFDPKPDGPASVRGDLGATATSVPGIQIGEKFPLLARQMQHLAILRGMSTAEADHGRARVYMHTGYRPGQGGVTYPGLGSTVAAEIGEAEPSLPNFIVTGAPLNKHDVVRDPGYRGPRHQPVVLSDLSRGLEYSEPAVATEEFNRRTALLNTMEQEFVRTYQAPPAQVHQAGLASALRLIRSPRRDAFDLSREPVAVRDAYGDCEFGRGCLLARRLVEAGVPFIEVYLANWDSHSREVAAQTRTLMSQVDAGMSALIRDLADRGLLESTLIVWMGEFGRTPQINTTGGRDHYSRAWTTVLAGGGVKGGQTIGATDARAAQVIDRPVSVVDFLATICRLLGIDCRKEVLAPNGRPIRIVDEGEKVVEEVFGV